MQKYRSDRCEVQSDGGKTWWADWMGGPSLSKVENCRLDNLAGDMRATVYVTGEADTWFSIPAVLSFRGCRVTGYLTGDDDKNLVFRHCYY